MPDIWTNYPEIVKEILKEAGFRCGVEPQILPRAASDTCRFIKEGFLGEIYVHQLGFATPNTLIALAAGVLLGVLISFLTAKLTRKR